MIMQRRPFNSLVCLLLSLWIAAPALAQGVTLLDEPFTFGLRGWTTQGKAQFSYEDFVGMRSARITVAAGEALDYQMLRFDVQDALPGDAVQVEATVRTAEDIADGTGPYLALEWLDAQGVRVGVEHSLISRMTGRKAWERLRVSGTAPPGTAALRLNLVLHSHGTAWFTNPLIVRTARQEAWPDLGNKTRHITIDAAKVIQPHFIGVGFHAFQHSFDYATGVVDNVIYRRWRELNPSFVRVNHEQKWGEKELDRMAEHLKKMRATGAEIYVTTWDPKDCNTPAEFAAYARHIGDQLEYLVRTKKCEGIRWYCLSNELTLGEWGKLREDLPKFKRYNEALFAEFKRRKLDIGLLATDAAPVMFWPTIDWAAQNMDSVTAVYGGHHYFTDPLDDERFYSRWFAQLTNIVDVAKAKGKPFLLGEFGSKQETGTRNGVYFDRCLYYDTPQEAQVGIQISEGAIAALNAGVAAIGYWTFMDFPDSARKTGYINQWGLFRCGEPNDFSTRAPYYAYGLLTRHFRGPSAVYAVKTDDPRLRVAAARQKKGNVWSIAVVNRNAKTVPVEIKLPGIKDGASLRKYVYDPSRVPQNPDGKLQASAATLAVRAETVRDTLPPNCLVVYATE